MSGYYHQIMARVMPGMLFLGSSLGALAALVMLAVFPTGFERIAIGGWVFVGGAIGAYQLRGVTQLERESGLAGEAKEAGDS